MRRPLRRLLAESGLVVVLLAGLWVFGDSARAVRYHDDESAYIKRGRYFVHLFVERDLANRAWRDNRSTHTQPMLANYVVGGWLWAHGYEDMGGLQVLAPYESWMSDEQNQERRRNPDWTLLGRARAPMVVVATAAVVVLYLLGRVLGGPLAGLAAAGLALGSLLVREYLIQARAEPLLICFLLLALLLGVVGARRGRGGGLRRGWAVALGVALGLACGSKLTAALSLAVVLGWGMLVAMRAALRSRRPDLGRVDHAWAVGRGWALALAVGLAVFVLSNPHLYPNPILHTAHLFQERAEDLAEHQENRPWLAVSNPLEQPGIVLERSFISETASGSIGLPLEALLATLGVAALLQAIRRDGLGRRPAEGLVLVTVAAYFAGISAGLGVAWARYFLPLLILGNLLSGLGLAAGARWLAAPASREKFRSALAGLARRRPAGPAGRPPPAELDDPERAPAH